MYIISSSNIRDYEPKITVRKGLVLVKFVLSELQFKEFVLRLIYYTQQLRISHKFFFFMHIYHGLNLKRMI